MRSTLGTLRHARQRHGRRMGRRGPTVQSAGMTEDHHEDGFVVRATEGEALANVRAVLQLCAAGKLRCSAKTGLPGAATVAAVSQALVGGDFYPAEPISAFAWPLLVQAGGLAELAGGRLQLTARGRAA